ncbi:BRCT domain DNA repair protein [Quillaja saponaria]|uniref:BRCT domain DNA repair protein n=1 Tax=Quillaja saponaria TaxID=32244 RepID=A0AAD7LBG3_QUISA|nr:BRCT domain DNA repair protein [Quillaja saponaria]
MGSLGIDNGENKIIDRYPVADTGCTQTQAFNSQSSWSSSPGEKESDVGDDYGLQHLHCNTAPFDDNLQLGDVFETQAVNLAWETQVMNIGGETQVVSVAGETQVMNIDDETQVLDDSDDSENRNTQLVDGFDEEVVIDSGVEETDRTEVLGDTSELFNYDPISGESSKSVDREKIQCEPLCENKEKTSPHTDAITGKQPSSGQMPPRFTYTHVEALETTALVNCSKALKGTISETYSVMTTSQSFKQLALKDNNESSASDSEKVREEVDQEHDHGTCTEHVKQFGDKQKSRIASSTVRKLFYDYPPAENKGCQIINNISREDLLDLSAKDGELAGLSYVDSQEPGELSQANALDFVDKFLKDNNTLEFDPEIDHGKTVVEKSKSLPSAKGQKSLAKITSNRNTGGGTGIFDWDDSREDEGGGDIFLRRKRDFFYSGSHRRKSFPQLQKNKGSRPDECIDDDKQLHISNKRTSLVNSDSRLVLHFPELNTKTVQEAKGKSKWNLVNALDEQCEIDSCRRQLEANATERDGQQMLNVGLDTQMAAEAMEALSNGDGVINRDTNNSNKAFRNSIEDHPTCSPTGKTKGISSSKKPSSRRKEFRSDMQAACRKSQRLMRSGATEDPLITESKRTLLSAEGNLTTGWSKSRCEMHPENIVQGMAGRALKRSRFEELIDCHGTAGVSGERLVKKRHLQDRIGDFTPVAYRTRRSSVVNQLVKPKRPYSSSIEENNSLAEAGSLEDQRNSGASVHASNVLSTKSSNLYPGQFGQVENSKMSQAEQLIPKLSSIADNIINDAFSCPRRRSHRNVSLHGKGSDHLDGSSKPSVQPGKNWESRAKNKSSQSDASRIQIPACACPVMSSVGRKLEGKLLELILDKAGSGDPPICGIDNDVDPNSNRKNGGSLLSAENVEVNNRLDESPRERYKSSDSACATPANCKTPVNAGSPICMGNEYYKQSCKRNLSRPSLLKEIRSLSATGTQPATPSKDLRKRRDMSDVRVLYSRHLDEDIIKHQKKILAWLGASVASSITDATHFIADQFVRTRNMLEAIASGKPVVTHLWLETCGQTSCFVEEKNYLLRDAKKEKEFGFNMSVSLIRACRHPLLEDRRVLITPNTKPSKEILSSLVKAVHGQAVERIGRSALKDDKMNDDLLILSCEEDYATCLPFLEKGASVYSSELLLNGIVTQKLEYERHRLFADNVKRTRSTIWLRKDGQTFLPVTKYR